MERENKPLPFLILDYKAEDMYVSSSFTGGHAAPVLFKTDFLIHPNSKRKCWGMGDF